VADVEANQEQEANQEPLSKTRLSLWRMMLQSKRFSCMAAVRRSDIEIATLNAQVGNLLAAMQASTQAVESTETESKRDASTATAATIEEGLEDNSAAALQRAAFAEANVQTLTSQVKDFQVELHAAVR
jgi:hypothetical protein